MTRLRAAAALCCALVGLGATPQDDARERADALVREGAALGERGAWAAAIARFREAGALFPRAIDHCNIGMAYVRWGRPAPGWLHLTRCEARTTEPLPAWVATWREDALAAMAQGEYAPVELVAEPRTAEARIDAFPDEVLTTPVTVWLPFGEHLVTVSAPTFEPAELRLVVEGPTPLRRQLTLSPVAEPTPPERPPEDDGGTAATDPGAGATPAETSATPVNPLIAHQQPPPPEGLPTGWWVTAGGAVVGAVGGVLYVVATGTQSDAAKLPPGDAFLAKRAAFRRERTAAYVLLAAGGAAVATGIVMLAWPDDAPVRVVPTDGGAALGLGGRF